MWRRSLPVEIDKVEGDERSADIGARNSVEEDRTDQWNDAGGHGGIAALTRLDCEPAKEEGRDPRDHASGYTEQGGLLDSEAEGGDDDGVEATLSALPCL